MSWKCLHGSSSSPLCSAGGVRAGAGRRGSCDSDDQRFITLHHALYRVQSCTKPEKWLWTSAGALYRFILMLCYSQVLLSEKADLGSVFFAFNLANNTTIKVRKADPRSAHWMHGKTWGNWTCAFLMAMCMTCSCTSDSQGLSCVLCFIWDLKHELSFVWTFMLQWDNKALK